MRPATDEMILGILQGNALTKDMTEEDVRALLSSSEVRLRSLARGELVFREGEMPQGLFVLIDGSLVIKKDTFSGREIFLSELERPGEIFGEVYAALQKTYDMYVEARGRARILEIKSGLFALGSAAASRPARLLQQNLLRIFAEKAYFMQMRIKVLASGSLREKIVRFLFPGLAADGTVHLTVSREYLAGCLAVSRPSLSRELSAMAKDGLLAVRGKEIRVLDMGRFEAYL